MDSSVFRIVARSIKRELEGGRIGKIFCPSPGFWTFVTKGRGEKTHLLFKSDKQSPFLFFSPEKPENPAQADARAMWFRKRVSGRRIVGVSADWVERRLFFELYGGDLLMLDLREGPRFYTAQQLEKAPVATESVAPEWPELAELLDSPDIWRAYPHVSPRLRKHLATLPEDAATALLNHLQEGEQEVLFVDNSGRVPILSLWPTGESDVALPPLEAASLCYRKPFWAECGAAAGGNREQDALKSVKRKVKRALQYVSRDEERLMKMIDGRRIALALQSELWKYKNIETPEKVLLHVEGEGEIEITLNTHLSVAENMERWFAKADKGERGLTAIAERKQALEEELSALEDGREVVAPAVKRSEQLQSATTPGGEAVTIPKRYRGLAVRLYRTDDNFLVIRGKNGKANHKILTECASPFDYWFHARGVAGAHVILRRDHPGQDVPDESVRQAAILAGLASGFKDAGKADVMWALVKDVRKIKGAAAGAVRVDSEKNLSVILDPDLERKLEILS